ncbi:MAG: phosphoadenylyl-sulfate reductase [Ferruginibacter sp.]
MREARKEMLNELIHQISGLNVVEALSFLADRFPGGTVFSSSLSYEDQVITHDILNNAIPVEIFTLDTGRLFAETYSVWNSTNERYGAKIKAYYPNQNALQEFVEARGPNSFYESVDNRKQCCYIRKVEPLQRALSGKSIWVTGLRAQHSAARHDLSQLEWDEVNQVIKYHPLLHWSFDEVKTYIGENNIPYNPLHDRGFVSIGCAPCTRAVKPGEDFRAGRWWWEEANKKECGLHATS